MEHKNYISMAKCFALIGWSLPVIESVQKKGLPFVVVSFPDFESYAKENDIPFVGYDLKTWSDQSNALLLSELLAPYGADVAVPLFEETVEWAGALNSMYRNDPRVLNRAYLFRDKAMMKRKALLYGLRVGYFEVLSNKEDAHRFLERMNSTNLQLPGEEDSWAHMKPFSAAGTIGHRFIKSHDDIDKKAKDSDFPCMIESHLEGQEFSCEAYIHKGEVVFLNITEYVKLGYSNYIPAGPKLQSKRDKILQEINKLVKGFGIEYGMIHPEWFLTEDDELFFGEVACRIPGGHILELVTDAYGFDALAAFVQIHDPSLSEEEVEALFPKEFPKNYIGNVMVFPQRGEITKLEIPEELQEDPYFIDHNLVPPIANQKVSSREGYGNHFGTVNFKGEDPERMKELLEYYQDYNFYV
jgi:hypothetical protein